MNEQPKPLSYLIFGDERELFAAHHIVKPPDFDQLLSIRLSGQAISDEELQGGVHVVLPGRNNHVTHRLRAGETVEGQVRTGGSDRSRTVQFKVRTEFYLGRGDLALPSGLGARGQPHTTGSRVPR
jgi:hypothetical protein